MKEPFVNYEHYQRRLSVSLKILGHLEGDIPPMLATELIQSWNCTWAIGREFMQAMWAAANKNDGPLLECGSGLSTLMLAIAARRHFYHVTAFEQKRWWADHMRRQLERYHLHHYATVHYSPLKVRGSYSWYTPDIKVMPKFKLVICDGPPGGTKGGRYGMLPVMGTRLARGCTIMLDDAGRPKEALVLKAWAHELGVKPAVFGTRKRYGVIQL